MTPDIAEAYIHFGPGCASRAINHSCWTSAFASRSQYTKLLDSTYEQTAHRVERAKSRPGRGPGNVVQLVDEVGGRGDRVESLRMSDVDAQLDARGNVLEE